MSFGYSKKIRGQQLRTGQKQRPRQSQHGPVSRLTAAVRERLRSWLQEQQDLTEAELRERLQGIGVGYARAGRDTCCAKWGCGVKKIAPRRGA